MAHLADQIRLLVETACRSEGKPPIVALVEVMDYTIARFVFEAAGRAAAEGIDPGDEHARKAAETDFLYVANDRFETLWSILPETDTFRELKKKARQIAERKFGEKVAEDFATLTDAMRNPRYAGQCIGIGNDGSVRVLTRAIDQPKKH